MSLTRIRVVLGAGLLAVTTAGCIVVLSAGSAAAGTGTAGPGVTGAGAAGAGRAAAGAGMATAGAGMATAGAGAPERAASIPGGQLFGVAATSASNAWAVGQATATGKSIILHWNGTAWKRATSPTLAGGSAFYAVAATSARNAWAVGGSSTPPGKTEIAHWNGTAWKLVPSPTPKGGGTLFGVAATSASNAWAVGCAGNCGQGFGGIKTLILHWNGTAWKHVPSPSPGSGSALSSVAAVSARSAWAVGCTAFCFLHSVSPQTVILHWNGTAWKQEPSPAPARTGALNGIAATSPSNAWAVGCAGHCFGPMATTRTMIVHWNGSAWRSMASPSPAGDSVLTAVAATSAGNAWAVGYTRMTNKTLILRWNGTAWKQVPSPAPGQISQLLGVTATSARNAWASGWYLNGVILQHWNGTAWK
jgi:hypothetical protein